MPYQNPTLRLLVLAHTVLKSEGKGLNVPEPI